MAVFIGVRLGPSLLGFRVFMGMDVLRLFAPWNYSDDRPVTSFWYMTDLIDSMVPALREVHDRFLDGDWASWSNLVGGGSALLSIPILGVLTPGRWLYLLMPTWLAPAWSKLLELAFGYIFTYLFARRLNASKLAAALAGVVYPLTGFMIGWNNYPQVAVGSVIPMLFWATERYLQQPRARTAVAVAVAVALLMLGGFPAVAGQALYVVGGYVVVRLITANRHRAREVATRLLWLAAAVGTGFALSAFQLLPFVHQVIDGVDLGYRSAGFFNRTAGIAALSSLFPQTFSTNTLCCTYSPQDINTYIGAVVLFLAVLGAIQAFAGRIKGSAGVYLVGVVAFVVMLIWCQGWWSSWMDALPIFHGNPIGRIRSQLGLPIAVLAAAGLDFLRCHRWSDGWAARVLPESGRLATTIARAMVVLIVISALVVFAHGRPFSHATLLADTALAAIPVAAIAVLAPLRRHRGVLLSVVVVGVVAQGLAATAYYWPTAARSEFYPSDPAIEYLQHRQGQDRIATTAFTMRANATAYYGLRTLNGHQFLDTKLKDVILGIDPNALISPTYTGFTTAVDGILHSPGLDRMGVHYLVAGVDDVLPGTTNEPVPIPGVADAMANAAGTLALEPGEEYKVSVLPGSMRGVNVPLVATASTRLTVTVLGPDGGTITSDTRRVDPGSFLMPVPLAADPANPTPTDTSQRLTVVLSVDVPGLSVTTDTTGQVRLQVVRPPAKGDSVRLAYAGSGLVVWERLGFVPRIHWASNVTVITDEAKRVQAVTTTPVTAGNVILAAAESQPVGGAPSAPATLQVGKDNGDNLTVRVVAPAAGYLVVSDTIQQDFVATVDGHPTPIASADEAGGAVYVPGGAHEVRVSYSPAGRTTGTAMSLASGGLLAVALLPPAWLAALRRRALGRGRANGAGRARRP